MKPILSNTDMVRALLDGRKTVTRRVVKPHFRPGEQSYQIVTNKHSGEYVRIEYLDEWEDVTRYMSEPYRPGDILYVRETWAVWSRTEGLTPKIHYKADRENLPGVKWRPSIHMPKEAARIFLRVTGVRVERLQDSFFSYGSTIFSLEDEGIDIGEDCRQCIHNYVRPLCIDELDEPTEDDDGECGLLDEVRGEFSYLWDSTIKPADRPLYGWKANPWVFVISFERITKDETL